MRKILKKSYLLIGLLIFIWIVKDIDFIQFKKEASIINFYYYAIALLFFIPISFFRSYRWKKIMDIQKIYYSVKDSFLIYGSSSLLGLATPGKLGDFSKMAYLKKDGHSLGKSFLGSFLDKFSDLLFIIVWGVISIPFLPILPNLTMNYGNLLTGAILLALVLLIPGLFFYYKKRTILYNFFNEIIEDLKKFKIKNILTIFLITSANWLFYFILVYFIALSLNLHQTIGFFYLSFTTAMGILLGILPITTLGIGTREAVYIFLLTPLGISKELIILFSLLVLANYLSLFLIYLYCWFKKPLI